MDTEVKNSRMTHEGREVWRRRVCKKCGGVFSSYERISLAQLIIKKRSGATGRYHSHKLFASLYDALSGGKHVDKGDSARMAQAVLGAIEARIVRSKKTLLTTSELVDLSTEELEQVDLGACYRYASFAPHRGMKFGI